MAAITSAVTGVVGLAAGVKSQRDQAKAQQQALAQATTDLPSIGFAGPGGFTAGTQLQQPTSTFGGFGGFGGFSGLPPELSGLGGFTGLFGELVQQDPFLQQRLADAGLIPQGDQVLQAGQSAAGQLPGVSPGLTFGGTEGNIGFNLGDLEPSRQGFVDIAGSAVDRAGAFGLPGSIEQAGRGVFDALSLAPSSRTAPIDQLGARAGGLANVAAGGASGILGQLGSTFDERFQSTLGNLRDLARPEEDRAFNRLQDRQFATGQLGTTGGGIQTEAFARGLAQADTARQLSALGEARAARASDLTTGQGLAGIFGSQANLLADLNTLGFNRQLGLSQLGVDRSLQGLQTALQLNQIPRQLQSADLANAITALGGQQGLFQQGLSGLSAALNQALAQGNLEIGAGTNLANIVGSSNFVANPTAALISDLAGSGALQQGIGALTDLFGGRTNTSSVGNPGFDQPFPT